MTRPRELLVELVETPSVSGEEAACADRLVEYFRANGREAWLDSAGNVRAPGDDELLLTSHLDTVPGEIPVRVEDGTLWGRGSVDAKGSLAALAVAAVRSGATFAGVVDEERRSRGARHLVADRPSPGAVINGEPSGWDGLTLGYRGLLAGTYVGTSESGHSSRPENNAIQDAFAWWTRVEAALERDEWHSAFERVTPKPVAVEGGPTPDGLSVEATVDVEFRVPPDRTAADVRELADGCLEAGTVNWQDAVEPVLKSPRTPVARAFRAAIRAADGEPRMLRKTGTSDMNVYAEAWGCPIVSYGPGDSGLDHAPDERLPLAAFDRAVGVLETVTERLL
ncbi:acetyl-lysine deacetylase [Halobacteriales archaeon QH_10_67_13]|nr:MAG: acetyl-lysine deacetylase [Halobacteriales archaeon QH_10_67_13]